MGAQSMESDFRFPAIDGYSLAATLRRPVTGPQNGFVLIASATATPRQFYGRFAGYLAAVSYTHLTLPTNREV